MTSAEEPAPTRCWCCDREYDERELVRLGAHPEVGICGACAVDIKQRAGQRQDELRPTWGTTVRTGVRRLRDGVIARGWHQRPLIGPILRRINRHLP
ncbi:hypothetical protein [Kribbella sp. NBC_00359]|uniref:hypothetical protein n=1 Tax=Kribbella sp. NBC_00359 TaxID=2975966 RepID=UPI002E246F3E